MSEILSKGLKMPRKGSITITIRHDGAISFIGDMGSNLGRLVDCKAIELPTHGRLIDADVLMETLKKVPITDEKIKGTFTKMMCNFAIQILEKSATVLEASTDDTEERG